MKTPEDWVREYWDSTNSQFHTTIDLVKAVRQEALDEIASFCVRQAGKTPDSDSLKVYIATLLSISTKIRNGDFT